MFSRKLKEELAEDLFSELDQLDRIEFQNKVIQQEQSHNRLLLKCSTFLVLMIISLHGMTSYSIGFQHLLKLGMYSSLYREAALSFMFIFFITGIMVIVTTFRNINMSNEFKKSNDEHLMSIIDKD